ncbi:MULTISPECIES: head GIN domain-containing protein [Myroides]|uniref:DUF2807 domain-containing protein n=1 Tax=Myroides albus TaxID=2562892 RepID=A0A6I3LF78_9FLAO|nr:MULTISPECIES: head GIN domain-containing protein [Myroides]MTG96547.1 DUF2807 domain-containing protein [Myroides albus]MVX34543.1 DUF2807 domain-containing protein [Myroides sp. LoEW2-1]UVD81039.1 DUF2807 domain-containing protein [Myroides albus]
MKKLAVLITLLVAQISFAQIDKEIGSFKKLSVFDQIEVTLIPTTGSTKIEIEGKKQDNVNVINKNEHLKIKMNFTNSYQGDEIKVTLYYKELNEINAGEGANVVGKGTLNANVLDVQGKTGSSIKLDIDTDKVNVKAGAGSIIRLTGKANVQDALSNSGADIINSKLVTKQTSVTVNAGGKASINATDVADAKVRAGGSISVYGNPKTLNEKTIAGGTIKKVE